VDLKEVFTSLNWVDFVIIFAFLRGAWVGYRDGLFAEIIRVFIYASMALGYVLFAPKLGQTIQIQFAMSESVANIIGGVIAAILIFIVFRFFAFIVLKTISVGEGFIFGTLGMVMAILRWAFILSLIFAFVREAGVEFIVKDIEMNSRFAPAITTIAPSVLEFTKTMAPDFK
jgi:hypothetical protein